MIWSTPVRRSGTVDLSPIPNEIYMEIFRYLRPKDPNEWIDAEARQDFCNLALVCRFFSSVMLPWIFENLQVVEKNSYAQISSPLSSTVSAKFYRSVLDGDPTALLLAKHVKRWTFSGALNNFLLPAFLSMYLQTFRHMSNLLELSLSNIVIPKEFFKRLANVPTLETLKLDLCWMEENVLEKHFRHFESVSLKQLVLSAGPRLVPYLNTSTLIRLELDMFPCIKTLPNFNRDLPLEYLYLAGAHDPSQIGELLEKTPRLKTLRVAYIRRSKLSRFALSPQAIPHLTKLEAPWVLCTQIVPGRPISYLAVSGDSRPEEVKFLASSTKPIIQLKILDSDLPLWEDFPNLECLQTGLRFTGDAWGKAVKSTFKKCSTHLRVLRLMQDRIPPLSAVDSQQDQVLEFLNATFPFLTRLEISEYQASPIKDVVDTWTYTRAIGGSWDRNFLTTRQRWRDEF